MTRALYNTCYIDWRVWKDIAKHAVPERWGFMDGDMTIFHQYVLQTFERLLYEGKVLTDSNRELMAFNTGLADGDGRDIIACLERNNHQSVCSEHPWRYLGYCSSDDERLGRMVRDAFGCIPSRASYTGYTVGAKYDGAEPVSVNVEHIIEDNLYRFPADYLEERLRDYSEVCKTLVKAHLFVEPLMRLSSQEDKTVDKRMCAKAYTVIQDDVALIQAIEADLLDAVEEARDEVMRDPSAAVSTFYPRAHCLNTIVPLRLRGSRSAGLALVVSSEGNGSYVGRTVFDLHTAYIDARLVGPVNAAWLVEVVRR